MMPVLRDYGPDGLSVMVAANRQGRVEPFAFADRAAAERAAEHLTGKGEVVTVLLWHGVELMDDHAAQRFAFGLRGLVGESGDG